MTVDRSAPDPVRSALLDGVSEGGSISHGFFSRAGGVSRGLYSGLNVGLGSKDDRDHVMENRSRVSRWFDLDVDRQEDRAAEKLAVCEVHFVATDGQPCFERAVWVL